MLSQRDSLLLQCLHELWVVRVSAFGLSAPRRHRGGWLRSRVGLLIDLFQAFDTRVRVDLRRRDRRVAE